ncbi:RDD family protein [Mycolicibacterium sp. GF69]|uniref:RDD family protein n=1 Tax=Mycolicibacterium sp. GF69 TaxID=2267251 RepID=UPI000DCB2432|nr:RDD family protein [Mycolicibacterium sp. GF69]RAV13918.1 RDD family protein [Mycolicibacterium sp. GF69]
MTDQPPPPPEGFPPPPPPSGYPQSGGTFPPPQAATGYSPPPQPVQALPTEAYTSWFTRVLAWLLDAIPIFILQGIGYALLFGTQETACITESSGYQEFCVTGTSTIGQLAIAVTSILVLAYVIWNYGYRQGTTGSSIGKSILKFKVVSENTGQPIGFGMSIVRQLAHIIDAAICYIGYLFPLWDAKRQTIADKLISTVCLPL